MENTLAINLIMFHAVKHDDIQINIGNFLLKTKNIHAQSFCSEKLVCKAIRVKTNHTMDKACPYKACYQDTGNFDL